MDFLKEILGEELYKQVADKIALHNGTPENKDKQIKLANLGEGGYVGKDKYAALETTHNSKLAELEQANTLISELQKSNKGNEELQKKIQNYDVQIQNLQAELAQAKLDSAIKVALLEAKAQDIDYLTFKLNEEKAEFKLDDNGKVKGLDEKIEGLKIKFPNQFENNGNKQHILENKLNQTNDNQGITKEAFNKMNYNERLKLYQENREQYDQLK